MLALHRALTGVRTLGPGPWPVGPGGGGRCGPGIRAGSRFNILWQSSCCGLERYPWVPHGSRLNQRTETTVQLGPHLDRLIHRRSADLPGVGSGSRRLPCRKHRVCPRRTTPRRKGPRRSGHGRWWPWCGPPSPTPVCGCRRRSGCRAAAPPRCLPAPEGVEGRVPDAQPQEGAVCTPRGRYSAASR